MTKASGKADSVSHPSFAQAFRFWVKLGFISFGGPAGRFPTTKCTLQTK